MPKGTYGILSSYLHWSRSRAVSRFIIPKDIVLDIGCGTGDFESFLPKGTTYFGIDVRRLWNKSKKNLFVQGIGSKLPKKIKNISVIVSLAVIEHLANPSDFFEYADSILKKNGLIILTTPHPWSRKVHDFGAKLGLFSRNASEDHEVFLNKIDLLVLAERNNFSMIHYKKFLFFMNQIVIFIKK